MLKKTSSLLFFSFPLVLLACSHGAQGAKAEKDPNERGAMKKEAESSGMWKPEDCKRVSGSSGSFLYVSGEALNKAQVFEKEGDKEAANNKRLEALALAELAANFAKNFEAYCKK